jgi:hypothetical protein
LENRQKNKNQSQLQEELKQKADKQPKPILLKQLKPLSLLKETLRRKNDVL